MSPEAGCCVVTIDGDAFATATGSALHPLVNALLFESPLNEATQ